jgi:iron complex transport system permease protein
MHEHVLGIRLLQCRIQVAPMSTLKLTGSLATLRISSERAKTWSIASGVVVLMLLSLVALSIGHFHVSFQDILSVIMGHCSGGEAATENRLAETIIWKIRLPRILLAINVGAALSISGTVFQGCFKNPLVDPYILGISSGAAFGAALGIVVPDFPFSIQALAFIFAFAAAAAAWGLARKRGQTPVIMLILAGVVIGSLFSAFVGILKYLAEDTALREIVFWLMGGFYYAGWQDVALLTPVTALCFALVLLFSWQLNILSMGDAEAKSLGVPPEAFKLVFILTATLATAVAVSSVGIIAWVGLMMPHAARMLIGPDNRYLIPMAAIIGAIYLITCDTIARTLVSVEIPIGIITSILGAPYLLYLLRSRGGAVFGGGNA